MNTDCMTSINQHIVFCCLSRFSGLGMKTLLKLSPTLENLHNLFQYSKSELLERGLSLALAEQIRNPPWEQAEKDSHWHQPENHRYIITYNDPLYPTVLRETNSPPMLLYVHGDPCYLSNPQISIVGTRNPSMQGQEIAYQFARELARLGFTVTSGLALGIDASAHRGALVTHGTTIAVSGTGLDKIYPARHVKLAQQIIEKGALISEFPCGTPIKPAFFPRRNRIISGLSIGVLVIEAAERSGSLITAKYAIDQGREVFAVPGSIYNPLSKGCHSLIRQGAKLVESVNDILEELPHLSFYSKPNNVKVSHEVISSPLSKEEQMVWQAIGFEVTMIDTLVERTAFPVDKLRSILLSLEVNKHIVSVPGGYQRAIRRASHE